MYGIQSVTLHMPYKDSSSSNEADDDFVQIFMLTWIPVDMAV